MKALVLLFLIVVIFGTAGYFGYEIFLKPARLAREEQALPPPPPPLDPSLPEFEKAIAIKRQGRLVEARAALEAFIENNPYSSKGEGARDALGEVNIGIFFSRTPAPEKKEYVVRSGEVLVRIAGKMKTTAELIMKQNNLPGIMLHIGDRLLISQPDFSLVVDRKQQKVILLNKGKFFKQYKPTAWSLPVSRVATPIKARVFDKIAWKDGKRVAFGTKEYEGSARWIALGVTGYTIYADPSGESGPANQARPPTGIALAPEDAEELSTLLKKHDPVTIQ
jgi:LysM repeat protein